MLKFADKENLVQQKKADTTNTIENVKTDSISNTSLYDSLKDNINTVQKKPSSAESSNKKTFQAKTSDVMQMKFNDTGLPDDLKLGIENLSGYSMDDVKVHYNSSKPTQMKALAYTQGTDIHIAPGQEKHLGHEAWHVVQQKQGRVQPTTQMKGININDNSALEHEADIMGAKATQLKAVNNNTATVQKKVDNNKPIQFVRTYYLENAPFFMEKHIKKSAEYAGKKRAKKELYPIVHDYYKFFNDIVRNQENFFEGKYERFKDYLVSDNGSKMKFIKKKFNVLFTFVNNQNDKNNQAYLTKPDEIDELLDKLAKLDELDELDKLAVLDKLAKLDMKNICLQIMQILSDWHEKDFIGNDFKVALLHEIFSYADTSNTKVATILKYLNPNNADERAKMPDNYNKYINYMENSDYQVLDLGNVGKAPLGKNENMIIVSHGIRPYTPFLRDFARYSPKQLASKIKPIIPDGYTGEIYLDGCHTGEPTALSKPKLNDGTSFAECFGKELVKLLKKSEIKANFTVKGNLGAASTSDEGKESITLDDRSRDLVKQREDLINNNHNIKKFYEDRLNSGSALSQSENEEYTKARNIVLDNKATSTDAHDKIYNKETEKLAGSATKMKYHFST